MTENSNNFLKGCFVSVLLFLALAASQPIQADEQQDTLFFKSFEELMSIKVEVASLFIEDEHIVGSTVSSISPVQWKRLGARRVSDVLANELSVEQQMEFTIYSFTKMRFRRGSPANLIKSKL